MSFVERYPDSIASPLITDHGAGVRTASRAEPAAWRGLVMVLATAQFVALTFAAMLLYPGGTKWDHATRAYSFFGNFFSDLGATVTHAGLDNGRSRALFVLALAGVGAGLLAFAPSWRFMAGERGRGAAVGRVAEICGVLSGVCFCGVGLVPWNQNLPLHNALVRLAFSLLLVFVAGLAAVQSANGWPPAARRANALYLALLCGYVFLLFRGPSLDVPSGFAVQVVAQKAIAYVSVLNLGFQGAVLRRTALA